MLRCCVFLAIRKLSQQGIELEVASARCANSKVCQCLVGAVSMNLEIALIALLILVQSQ